MPISARQQYLIEEMNAGRTRIDQEISAMNKFETVSVLAIGAIYWIFFDQQIKDHGALIFLSGLPVIICAYGLFRYVLTQALFRFMKVTPKKLSGRFWGGLEWSHTMTQTRADCLGELVKRFGVLSSCCRSRCL
jgi:hypothetical protein